MNILEDSCYFPHKLTHNNAILIKVGVNPEISSSKIESAINYNCNAY